MYMNRKGVVFGYKDTFSLDYTLSPIILAALKKFKEVITDPKRADFAGVPSVIVADLFSVDGKYPETTDEQMHEAVRVWYEIIDKMIYAFDVKNEPKISDYNFKINMREVEKFEDGSCRVAIDTENEKEYQRYQADEEKHNKAVQEGRELFGKYFSNLWW